MVQQVGLRSLNSLTDLTQNLHPHKVWKESSQPAHYPKLEGSSRRQKRIQDTITALKQFTIQMEKYGTMHMGKIYSVAELGT